MGERKVLNRYVPPDFDPKIIPKFKREKFKPCEVRTMLPFSMRCETCGEYMGRGKKFNSRKEYCQGEDYMKIRRWRFIVKCSVCNAEISFKTDPKNTDYAIEYGAVRNYEVWKDNNAAIEEDAKAREEEDADAMKSLENRTLDSKMEMDILDTLDEIKAMNQRHERVDTDALLRKRNEQELRTQSNGILTAADEEMVKSARFRGSRQPGTTLSDDEEERNSSVNSAIDIYQVMRNQLAASKKHSVPTTTSVNITKKKKRKEQKHSAPTVIEVSSNSSSGANCESYSDPAPCTKRAKVKEKKENRTVLHDFISGYGSSSGEES